MRPLHKWIEQWADTESFRPMLILRLGVGMTLLFFVVAGLCVWQADLHMIRLETRASEFHNHLSRLLFDHERWTDHLLYVSESSDSEEELSNPTTASLDSLMSALDKFQRTVHGSVHAALLQKTSSRLVELQDSAASLICAHRKAAATAVVTSGEYAALMRTLHESVHNDLELAVRESANADRAFNAWLKWISVLAAFLFVALTLAWIAVMRLVGLHLERRRQTEAELTESEGKYRVLIDALPHAVLIAQDKRFVFCNSAAVSMFRVGGAEDLIGASSLAFVADNDRERAEANADARARQDNTACGHFTITMHRADGKEFPAEVFARTVNYKGRSAGQYVVLDLTERARAESDLRESEEKYRLLIDALPHAVVMMQNSKIVFCNPAAATMFGYPNVKEMIGLHRDVLVPDQERARAAEESEKFFNGELHTEAGFQINLLRRNQEEFPAEVNGRRVTYGGNVALQLVILDATERKRVENALRESEERFRNLSDNAPVLIWMAGVGRHTFYFNKSWIKFTGRSVGQEYGHGWKQSVHPDDLPRCIAAYESAFSSRTSFTVEYRMRHFDSTYHWVLDTGVPRFAADGSFAGFVGSCVDITARRSAEEAMRESEKRFRDLADFLPHTIFEADEHGNLTFVNRRVKDVLGYTVQDLDRGFNVFDMLIESDRERARMNFGRMLTGENATRNEYAALSSTGQKVPVVVDSSAFFVDGKLRGVRGMVIDITEQKRAERELRQLNRALRTIGQCNQAVIHADDEVSLLNEICGIIVQTGGHRMAWVGYAQSDDEKAILPVAFAGSEQGYLQSVRVTWDDTDTGRGPTGTAIKTRQPSVNRDIATGTFHSVWQAEAIKRGYRSSVALPIVTGDRCIGVLNIYSGEAEAFDDDEVSLLSRLADDMAYGIAALRTREEQMLTETALRESEQTLRRTFDQSPIGAGIVARNGHFLRVNETLCQMIGYSAEELCRLTFGDITHPDDLARDVRNIELLTAGGMDLYETDKRYIRKDGSVMWGHLSVCALRDAGGNVIHFLPMIQDITERKDSEEALRQSETRFRRLFTDAAVGMGISDPDGYIIDIIAALQTILGYNRNDLSGKRFSDITHQDDLEVDRRLHSELREGIRDQFVEEKRYIRKDGVPITVSVTVFAIRAPDNGVSCCVGMMQDITERKRADALLREQAAAIEAAMDGVAILDSNGCYVYVNEEHARVYGYACATDLVGKSWEALYDEVELKRFQEVIMPRFWENGHWRGAATGKRRDGSKFQQEIALSRTSTGGLVCIVRDITQRQLCEEVLMNLSRVSDEDARENASQLLQAVRQQLALLTQSAGQKLEPDLDATHC